MILEKTQPSRMVLEEITDNSQNIREDYFIKYKWWREVKETGIPLTNDDPKLSISKEGMERVIKECNLDYDHYKWIAEKIKARRIVLEETEEDNQKNVVKNIWCAQFFSHDLVVVDQPKIWREVKETDIPLTNDDPNLSLNVNDSIKWAESLILQLDENHQGRNSWLCHYGRSKQAEEARKKSIFRFLEVNGRYNISKRKDD